ncbi:class A beta-lactamase [Phyllobacterium salinisoli]|uniref:Beta-lactamase n=1 Tax=Phyllobacterium salinisoli TaxID=1899321 RepID=A0A368K169_9HYPH|nr:PAD family carbapenem-hydrolyzing class A beta-lactamase [Phyllobacterium salinisoli]RCS22142.1 class A beta-lactamase [Phyllobacterium salinisoli]
MTTSISRRRALAGSLLAIPALTSLTAAARAQTGEAPEGQLAELERRHGGRIGVAVLDLATGQRLMHRADERFLMCSTFKALTAGFILARVDQGEEQLDRRIVFSKKDIVVGSPATQERIGGTGMSVAELCQATLTLSDNAAANLLLASFGGPAGLTGFLRSIGDEITRLDRFETDLNVHETPGDLRDTTTPAAMLETLRKLLFGNVLSRSSRAQLAAWMIMNKTGDAKLRAGFPDDWTIADKTGGNGDKFGNSNDVAIAWSPDRGAVMITAYCEIPSVSEKVRAAVLAEIGRIAAQL